MPYVENVFGIVISILLIGWVIDLVSRNKAVKAWQDQTASWWITLSDINWNKITNESNGIFNNLFDAIYGKYFFSWNRVFRSAISSILAISITQLIVGTEKTGLDIESIFSDFQYSLFIFLVYFSINLVADYVSLLETRWVLGKACDSRFIRILLLMILDLILTSVIFFLVTCLVAQTLEVIGGNSFWRIVITPKEFISFLGWDEFGIYFTSTFFTSILWFLFVSYVVFIKAIQQCSSLAMKILEKINETGKPAQLISGFISMIILLIYGSFIGISVII